MKFPGMFKIVSDLFLNSKSLGLSCPHLTSSSRTSWICICSFMFGTLIKLFMWPYQHVVFGYSLHGASERRWHVRRHHRHRRGLRGRPQAGPLRLLTSAEGDDPEAHPVIRFIRSTGMPIGSFLARHFSKFLAHYIIYFMTLLDSSWLCIINN